MSYQSAFTPLWRIFLALLVIGPMLSLSLGWPQLNEDWTKAFRSWSYLAVCVYSVVGFLVPAVSLLALSRVIAKPAITSQAHETLRGLLDNYIDMPRGAGLFVATFSAAVLVLALANELFAASVFFVGSMFTLLVGIGLGEKASRKWVPDKRASRTL